MIREYRQVDGPEVVPVSVRQEDALNGNTTDPILRATVLDLIPTRASRFCWSLDRSMRQRRRRLAAGLGEPGLSRRNIHAWMAAARSVPSRRSRATGRASGELPAWPTIIWHPTITGRVRRASRIRLYPGGLNAWTNGISRGHGRLRSRDVYKIQKTTFIANRES